MTDLQGTIIKGIGGFYYVDTQTAVYECRARGKFRLMEMTPLVGDCVVIQPERGKLKGYVTEILPRSNELLRPAAANIGVFVLVLSASVPKPDLLLADKLLLQATRAKAKPVICINKCDEADVSMIAGIACEYGDLGADILTVSAKDGTGLSGLADVIKGNICCFAGQSAVGKSSLLNALSPGLSLETGVLSKKTDRGRHTTRHAELLPVCGGYVADTPGFSLLELPDMEPSALCSLYPEMKPYLGKCRFDDCLHDAEPNCAVKEAVEAGAVPRGRYERYRDLLNELREMQKRRFD